MISWTFQFPSEFYIKVMEEIIQLKCVEFEQYPFAERKVQIERLQEKSYLKELLQKLTDLKGIYDSTYRIEEPIEEEYESQFLEESSTIKIKQESDFFNYNLKKVEQKMNKILELHQSNQLILKNLTNERILVDSYTKVEQKIGDYANSNSFIQHKLAIVENKHVLEFQKVLF